MTKATSSRLGKLPPTFSDGDTVSLCRINDGAKGAQASALQFIGCLVAAWWRYRSRDIG